jgi:copper transport protein
VVMAWIILPTAGELTNTGYGLALVAKVSLVLVVIGLGAFNRFGLVPAVQQRSDADAHGGQETARRWLGRVVLAELAVLLAVVGVTAVMVTRSPLQPATAAAPATAGSRQNLTVQLSGDGGVVEVAVAPARAGFNTIDLVLRDIEGRIVNPIEAPVVELSQHDAHVGPLRPDVLPLAIGRYQANTDLAIAGDWELSVRFRISDFESVSGSAAVTIGQD